VILVVVVLYILIVLDGKVDCLLFVRVGWPIEKPSGLFRWCSYKLTSKVVFLVVFAEMVLLTLISLLHDVIFLFGLPLPVVIVVVRTGILLRRQLVLTLLEHVNALINACSV